MLRRAAGCAINVCLWLTIRSLRLTVVHTVMLAFRARRLLSVTHRRSSTPPKSQLYRAEFRSPADDVYDDEIRDTRIRQQLLRVAVATDRDIYINARSSCSSSSSSGRPTAVSVTQAQQQQRLASTEHASSFLPACLTTFSVNCLLPMIVTTSRCGHLIAFPLARWLDSQSVLVHGIDQWQKLYRNDQKWRQFSSMSVVAFPRWILRQISTGSSDVVANLRPKAYRIEQADRRR